MAYTIAACKVAEELFASTTMEENTMQGRTPTSKRAEVRSTGARPRDDVQDKAAHGTLDMERAITVSCNAYFAQLGYHIGAQPLLMKIMPVALLYAGNL